MKLRNRIVLGTLALIALVVLGTSIDRVVRAQNPLPTGSTLVQPTLPQYNCNQVQTATSAGNGGAVVTFAAVPGQTFHVCSVYIAEVANATVTVGAGPAPIETASGFQNNPVWWGDNSALAQGVLKVIADEIYPYPIPALPNTAVTITNSAGQSTQNVRITVTGFYGPF